MNAVSFYFTAKSNQEKGDQGRKLTSTLGGGLILLFFSSFFAFDSILVLFFYPFGLAAFLRPGSPDRKK